MKCDFPSVKIEPKEAVSIFEFARAEEIMRVKELFEEFKKSVGLRDPYLWGILDKGDTMSLLAFAYNTGRVQGIREERSKRH